MFILSVFLLYGTHTIPVLGLHPTA